MYEVDNQQSSSGADNSAVQQQAQVPQTDQAQHESSNDVASGGESQPQQQQNTYQPFSNGKERFKIDGEEVELDWDSAKKHISLGKTAYKRMQEAAELKTQTQKAYRELLELAQRDPDSLIRALNPNYNPQLPATGQPNGQSSQQRDQVTDTDPRDLELRSVRQELGALKSSLEKQEIDQERKIIDQELSQAAEKYALKNDRFAKDYIKQEYRRALQSGMDVSIDDVAFYVAQEMKNSRNQQTQETKQRIEQKRKQAPVNVISAGSEQSAKPMSLDDVKKLAGKI